MSARSTFSFYIINNGTAGKNENLLILLIFILRNLDRLRGPAQGAVAAVFIMFFFFFFKFSRALAVTKKRSLSGNEKQNAKQEKKTFPLGHGTLSS